MRYVFSGNPRLLPLISGAASFASALAPPKHLINPSTHAKCLFDNCYPHLTQITSPKNGIIDQLVLRVSMSIRATCQSAIVSSDNIVDEDVAFFISLLCNLIIRLHTFVMANVQGQSRRRHIYPRCTRSTRRRNSRLLVIESGNWCIYTAPTTSDLSRDSADSESDERSQSPVPVCSVAAGSWTLIFLVNRAKQRTRLVLLKQGMLYTISVRDFIWAQIIINTCFITLTPPTCVV